MRVWIQDITTRWCLSVQRKIIIGFFIIVFCCCCSLKVVKSVHCTFKHFSCYILTRVTSQQPSSRHCQKRVSAVVSLLHLI